MLPCKFPFKYKQDQFNNCIKHKLLGQGVELDICPISNNTFGKWLENQEYGICNFDGCEVPKGIKLITFNHFCR